MLSSFLPLKIATSCCYRCCYCHCCHYYQHHRPHYQHRLPIQYRESSFADIPPPYKIAISPFHPQVNDLGGITTKEIAIYFQHEGCLDHYSIECLLDYSGEGAKIASCSTIGYDL